MKTAKTKRSPEYAVPALDKGLDLLESLAANAEPQSLTDMARLLDRSPGELFRLLQRLERRSYIRKDPVSGKYSLTLKLFELSHTHSPLEDLLRAAGGPMRELANTLRESVHLSVLSQGALLVLREAASPNRVRFSHEVGGRFSAVGTNSGRLLLAALPESDRDALLGADEEFMALGASGQKKFLAELATIQRRGYTSSVSEEIEGIEDIAVPVGNPNIGHSAALAIGFLRRGKSKKDILNMVRALQACAAQITTAQGLNT